MNYRPSKTTKPVALRLPNAVYEVLERRAKKQGKLVSEMVRARIVYDTQRQHKKKLKSQHASSFSPHLSQSHGVGFQGRNVRHKSASL